MFMVFKNRFKSMHTELTKIITNGQFNFPICVLHSNWHAPLWSIEHAINLDAYSINQSSIENLKYNFNFSNIDWHFLHPSFSFSSDIIYWWPLCVEIIHGKSFLLGCSERTNERMNERKIIYLNKVLQAKSRPDIIRRMCWIQSNLIQQRIRFEEFGFSFGMFLFVRQNVKLG